MRAQCCFRKMNLGIVYDALERAEAGDGECCRYSPKAAGLDAFIPSRGAVFVLKYLFKAVFTVSSLGRQRECLLLEQNMSRPRATKDSASLSSEAPLLQCNPVYAGMHLGSPSGTLGSQGNRQSYVGDAACCAVRNKVLCL